MKKITIGLDTVERIIRECIKESVYYHGTPYANSANSIEKNGLGGSTPTRMNGGDVNDGDFASAQGRQYLTKSGGNAMRYATMMQGNEPYGHVFEFDTDDNSLGVDEDEVGSIVYRYLNGKIEELPFDINLLKNLSKQELSLIKNGDFRGFTACKKIIDKLNPNEVQNILRMSNNATTNNVLKPKRHWIVPRPNKEQLQDLVKSKDFTPYDQYFEKNKRLSDK